MLISLSSYLNEEVPETKPLLIDPIICLTLNISKEELENSLIVNVTLDENDFINSGYPYRKPINLTLLNKNLYPKMRDEIGNFYPLAVITEYAGECGYHNFLLSGLKKEQEHDLRTLMADYYLFFPFYMKSNGEAAIYGLKCSKKYYNNKTAYLLPKMLKLIDFICAGEFFQFTRNYSIYLGEFLYVNGYEFYMSMSHIRHTIKEFDLSSLEESHAY